MADGGGGGSASASGRRCCGGCGLGLARLVRRLRRRGRRALCSGAARPPASRLAGRQYDPLSYARNFDLGGDDGDGDGAMLHHSCSFSSRFVLAPASSSSSVAAAPSSRPIAAVSH
ncbi:hypothetical protein ACP4OV_009480 [Aristida adscensionis]